MTSIPSLSECAAWKRLEAHYEEVQGLHLRKLFADDPGTRRAVSSRGTGDLFRLLEEPYH